MKTAAAVFVVLAVVFVGGKKKKRSPHTPPPVEQHERIDIIPDLSGLPIDPEMGKRIANFILASNPNLDGETIKAITAAILQNSEYFDVDPRLITALIRRESTFNPRAVSPSNAQGLGQLMPLTGKSMGVDDPFDIDQNVYGTVKYFRMLLDMWQDESDQIRLSFASYKIGPNAVRQHGKVPDLPDVVGYINDILRYAGEI